MSLAPAALLAKIHDPLCASGGNQLFGEQHMQPSAFTGMHFAYDPSTAAIAAGGECTAN